jgi:mRNA interferase HigB
VIVIGADILVACMDRHARSRKRIAAWNAEAKAAAWRTPNDIKRRFRSADFLPGNRVVFDIGGNEYRIIVVAQYTAGVIDVRFAGDHKEYGRVDAARI